MDRKTLIRGKLALKKSDFSTVRYKSGSRSRSPSSGDTEAIFENASLADHAVVRQPTFHQFPRLPYEICFQIWELSIFQPRVVELKRVSSNASTTPLSFPHFVCASGPPAALSVSHETRVAAFPRYTLFRNGHIRLFLNPSIDTFYFGAHFGYNTILDFIQCVPPEEWARVERFAVLDGKLNEFARGDRRQFYSEQPSSFLGGSVFHSVTIWMKPSLNYPSVPIQTMRSLVRTLPASSASFADDSDDDW